MQCRTSFHRSALWLCVMAAVAQIGAASEGNHAPEYAACLKYCLTTGCTRVEGVPEHCDTVCPSSPHQRHSAVLQLTGWDCQADCRYHCMTAMEDSKRQRGASAGAVVKYYGKWPFVRVLGAQEILSVLFSIGNLAAHAHNLAKYLQQFPKRGRPGGAAKAQQLYPYYWLWPLYGVVSINAWLWSSVFHTRDTRVTEKFDYFSADTLAAVTTFVTVTRTMQLQAAWQRGALGAALGLGLLQHIHYMMFVKFDYGYNMALCVACGVTQSVLWVVWCSRTQHPARHSMFKFLAAVHVAMMLEIFDFPPILGLLDAHAAWHAATIPLVYVWYDFVFGDVRWESAQTRDK